MRSVDTWLLNVHRYQGPELALALALPFALAIGWIAWRLRRALAA